MSLFEQSSRPSLITHYFIFRPKTPVLAVPTMAPNPLDYVTIQNTLSRYCIALDTKDFNLLKQVFTEDCDTVYPFGGQIKGVQKVADAISNRYRLHS